MFKLQDHVTATGMKKCEDFMLVGGKSTAYLKKRLQCIEHVVCVTTSDYKGGNTGCDFSGDKSW
jgi:hypothetical protein